MRSTTETENPGIDLTIAMGRGTLKAGPGGYLRHHPTGRTLKARYRVFWTSGWDRFPVTDADMRADVLVLHLFDEDMYPISTLLVPVKNLRALWASRVQSDGKRAVFYRHELRAIPGAREVGAAARRTIKRIAA